MCKSCDTQNCVVHLIIVTNVCQVTTIVIIQGITIANNESSLKCFIMVVLYCYMLFHVFILFANSLVIELLMEVIRVQRKKLICLLPISVKCNLVIIMKPNTSQVFSSRFTHTHISRHIAKIRDILLVHILYEGYG